MELLDGTRLDVVAVINCTGPRSDMDRLALPLLADLRRRGLIAPDPLGLGIETQDCAALGSAGHVSPWLFALGPLTRPACFSSPVVVAHASRSFGRKEP